MLVSLLHPSLDPDACRVAHVQLNFEEDNNSVDHLSVLPAEVVEVVLSFLSPEQIWHVRLVCKGLGLVARSPALWEAPLAMAACDAPPTTG